MGTFFQMSNGVMSVVERDDGVDTIVTRNNWIDKFDGTGSSGLTIDFTKAQIFTFDQEWLGVGRVRMGFVINGNFYPCY